MQFQIKSFKELANLELYEIYKLRSKVFVVEQNCVYQDIDDKDPGALHVIGMQNEKLLAYARILPPFVSYTEPSIGRVVVEFSQRKKKLGKDLMIYTLNKTIELYQNQDVVISAQAYLLKFYKRLGFTEEGEAYLEDNIPHVKMRFISNA